MKMTVRLVLILGALSAGCADRGRNWEFWRIDDSLPPGWALMTSSQVPPSDKMPWWTQNPQVLERGMVDTNSPFERLNEAIELYLLGYSNAENDVAIIIGIGYPTAQQARKAHKSFAKSLPMTDDVFVRGKQVVRLLADSSSEDVVAIRLVLKKKSQKPL